MDNTIPHTENMAVASSLELTPSPSGQCCPAILPSGGAATVFEEPIMERGWIKLWRKTSDSQVWSHSVEMRSLWLTLLLRANHAAGWFKGTRIAAGQLAASFATLADDARLTVNQVRYHLDLLETWGKVTRIVTHKYQVITLCKWDTYQCDDRKSHTKSHNEVTTKSQDSHNEVTTNKNNNNNNNDKNEITNTPLPPKGARVKKVKGLRVETNSPLMIQIGQLFNRQPDTLWTQEEAATLSAINPTTAEVALISDYYSANIPEDKNYRRRDLKTLLNNWTGELDRANEWQYIENKKRRI